MRITMRLAESRYRFHGDVWGSEGQADVGTRPRCRDRRPRPARRPARARGRLPSQQRHALARGARGVGGGRSASTPVRAGKTTTSTRVSVRAARSVWATRCPKTLRLALGVSLRNSTRRRRCRRGPTASRCAGGRSIASRCATRELGLQAEYALTPVIEVYLAGYRSTDRFRLTDRDPLGDLSFRDRRVQVGAGFEWKLSNWLRLALEGGAIVDRRIRVHEEDLGTLLSRNGDPSGYFEVRVELRL